MILIGDVIPANACPGIDSGKNGGFGSGGVPPAIFLISTNRKNSGPTKPGSADFLAWRHGCFYS